MLLLLSLYIFLSHLQTKLKILRFFKFLPNIISQSFGSVWVVKPVYINWISVLNYQKKYCGCTHLLEKHLMQALLRFFLDKDARKLKWTIFWVHNSTLEMGIRRFKKTGRDVRKPVHGSSRATDITDYCFLTVNALPTLNFQTSFPSLNLLTSLAQPLKLRIPFVTIQH